MNRRELLKGLPSALAAAGVSDAVVAEVAPEKPPLVITIRVPGTLSDVQTERIHAGCEPLRQRLRERFGEDVPILILTHGATIEATVDPR